MLPRLACLACLFVASSAFAQTPAPNLDDHIARMQALRKQLALVQSANDAAAAQLAALKTQLDALGIKPVPPGPTPPNPNPPTPPIPPVDPLATKLKAAFLADTGKSADAKQLGSLYSLAANLSADKTVASSNALLSQVRDAAGKLIGADALPTLRGVVALELAAVLGVPSDTALTQPQRDAAATLFAKLATILEGF